MTRCLTALLAVTLLAPSAAGAQPRDSAFWIALKDAGFAVAHDDEAFALLTEMDALLASREMTLRDEVAFAAAERWIYREKRFTAEQLGRLTAMWQANLAAGLGQAPDDSALKRSFSALCLSMAAARDLETPFLEPAEYDALLEATLDYLRRERDRRGWVEGLGWVHAVAHASDLVRFLARNPKLRPEAHPRILETYESVLTGTPAVFTWGEQERIGYALHSLVRRDDFDAASIEAWAAAWIARHRDLWRGGPSIDPALYPPLENAKHVMRALVVAISLELKPPPSADASRLHLLRALGTMR